jgi:hypothetical protein
MIKMKYKKIFVIMIVMILLAVNVSFILAKEEDKSWSSSRRYTSDFETFTSSTRGLRGNTYYEVKGSDEDGYDTTEYNSKGQPRASYHTNKPPTTTNIVVDPEAQTGGTHKIDTDGDGKTDDEQERFVTYVGGWHGNGYVDRGRVYDAESGVYMGKDYDSKTGTYTPSGNDDIRVGANGLVYVDTNGDGDVDIHDMDSDGDGEIDDDAAATDKANQYNPATGRFQVDPGRYVDEGGELYDDSAAGNQIGIDFQYYQNGAYSYDEDVAWGFDPTRMVVDGNIVTHPDTREVANVDPDGAGGYVIDDVEVRMGDRSDGARDFTGTNQNIHFLAVEDTFVAVVDGMFQNVIFMDDDRDGVADGRSFGIDSSVSVSDPWFADEFGRDDESGIVVHGTDGNFYVIDSNQDLDDLVTGDAKQIDQSDIEEIFGTGGINFWQSYGVYRLGTMLDDFSASTEGYPGFSIFYDEDEFTLLSDSELARDLVEGGIEQAWGNAICTADAADTVGGNVAGGSELGSPVAYVLAEEYLMPDPIDPNIIQYLYLIEVYVYAGENAPSPGCHELDFKVVIKRAGATTTTSLYENDETGGDYVWELGESGVTAYTSDYLLTASANTSRKDAGDEICIEIIKMETAGCLQGVGDGIEISDDVYIYRICDTITAVSEQSYDYSCSGDIIGISWCDAFLSDAGWTFAEEDDVAGDPVPTNPTTPTGSPVPIPSLDP